MKPEKNIPLWKPPKSYEGLSQGPVTEQFEEKVAKYLEVKYAVACSSGTAAIYLALTAARIGPGSKVVVPNLTAIGTVNAVSFTGAEVRTTDVNAEGLLELYQGFPEADAIVPVHLNGRRCPAGIQGDYSKRPKGIVIEDACHAFGSNYDGLHKTGTTGLAGCFSFSPTKNIYTGQGGMVVTDHYWLADRVRLLRDQGRRNKSENYFCRAFNFKYTDTQATLGLHQLENIDVLLKRKREIYELYHEQLTSVMCTSYTMSVGETLWLPDIYVKNRDKLQKALWMKGIGSRAFYPPLNIQFPYFAPNDYPISEYLSQHGLWLPGNVTDEEVAFICDAVKEFLAK